MFELLNVKWGTPEFGTPSGTITWSSELGGDLPLSPSTDLADITNSLRSAFAAWEDVAAVDFQEVSTGGDVVVGTANLTPPVVAQAGPFPVNPSSLFTMETAEVEFSTNQVWSPFGGDGGINFYAVAAHEIGHVIGLQHPDPADPSQIMNAEIAVSDLSDIDKAGAQFIYGTDGDDVPIDLGDAGDPDVASAGGDSDGGGGGGGLILGLLALVAALFTGGGALVAMAAGRLASGSNSDEANEADLQPDPEDFSSEDLAAIFGAHHDCFHTVGDDGMGYHGVTVAGLMPEVDFTAQPNPCGCIGLCEHIIERDDPVDDYVA